jgi:hypothetical protein
MVSSWVGSEVALQCCFNFWDVGAHDSGQVYLNQPLAGASSVDNADEIQSVLLGDASDKVILAINGHSHMDEVIRVKGVTYMHVNSASYTWVGASPADLGVALGPGLQYGEQVIPMIRDREIVRVST